MIERVAQRLQAGGLVFGIAGQSREPVERAKEPLLVGQVTEHPFFAVGPFPFDGFPGVDVKPVDKQRRRRAVNVPALRQRLVGKLAHGGQIRRGGLRRFGGGCGLEVQGSKDRGGQQGQPGRARAQRKCFHEMRDEGHYMGRGRPFNTNSWPGLRSNTGVHPGFAEGPSTVWAICALTSSRMRRRRRCTATLKAPSFKPSWRAVSSREGGRWGRQEATVSRRRIGRSCRRRHARSPARTPPGPPAPPPRAGRREPRGPGCSDRAGAARRWCRRPRGCAERRAPGRRRVLPLKRAGVPRRENAAPLRAGRSGSGPAARFNALDARSGQELGKELLGQIAGSVVVADAGADESQDGRVRVRAEGAQGRAGFRGLAAGAEHERPASGGELAGRGRGQGRGRRRSGGGVGHGLGGAPTLAGGGSRGGSPAVTASKSRRLRAALA